MEFISLARRGERFAGQHHGSRAYQLTARFAGVYPEQYLRQTARKKAETLYDSGELVTLTFLVPNLMARLPEIRDRCRTNSRCVLWSASDRQLDMFVRPAHVAYCGSEFCQITNRVAFGDLRKFAGNSDEAEFRLPDGSVVDLDACHKWLNESIASGRSVGLAVECRAVGGPVFHAFRKEPETNAHAAKHEDTRYTNGSVE
jgi:hypothetical protein